MAQIDTNVTNRHKCHSKILITCKKGEVIFRKKSVILFRVKSYSKPNQKYR